MRVFVLSTPSKYLLDYFIQHSPPRLPKIFAGSISESFPDFPQVHPISFEISKSFHTVNDNASHVDVLINEISIPNFHNFETIQSHALSYYLKINCGTLLTRIKAFLPLLKKSSNPHIINICAPVNLNKDYFNNHFNMTFTHNFISMATIGLSKELMRYKIGVNSLWTKESCLNMKIMDSDSMDTLSHLANSIHHISRLNSFGFTGNQLFAEDLLNVANRTSKFPSFLVGDYSQSPYFKATFSRHQQPQSISLTDCVNILQHACGKFIKENKTKSFNLLLKVGYPKKYLLWLFKCERGVCDLSIVDNKTIGDSFILVKLSEGLFVNLLLNNLDIKYLEFNQNFSWKGTFSDWKSIQSCLRLAQMEVQQKLGEVAIS